MKIRAAIVGAGGIAEGHHLPALREHADEVDVVAVMDSDVDRAQGFAERNAIDEWFVDLDKMLERSAPDLVHIASPPGVHAEQSVACLNANAWVWCEKPVTRSLAEIDAIAEAESRSRGRFSVVQQWRTGSAVQHVRSLMAANAMGRPLVGMAASAWFRDMDYYAVSWRGNWETEAGGPTVGTGIHITDLLLYLLGDWAEVRAMIGRVARPIRVEDTSMAMVRFESGAMASLVNTVLAPRQQTSLRLDFERGTVEANFLYGYSNRDWTFTPASGVSEPAEIDSWRAIPTDVPCSHSVQFSELLASIREGSQPAVGIAEARRTVEFISSLYKSAIAGVPVQRGALEKTDAFYQSFCGDDPYWR